MANITSQISTIERASRGEEVRDALVAALNAMNDGIQPTVESALEDAKESGDFDGPQGVSPSVSISAIEGGHRLDITDAEHPSGQSIDIMNGISPTLAVSAIEGGHRLDITDAEHPSGQSIDIMNGISPTLAVSAIEGGHRLGITDAEHPSGQSIDIMNGISPTLAISAIEEGYRLVITDAEHPSGQSFTILHPEVSVVDDIDGVRVSISDTNHPSGQSFYIPTGVSPVVNVTEIAGGHRIIITDVTHPNGQVIDIMDGSGGSATGSGDMEASLYDPDNHVSSAGGIPLYVSNALSDVQSAVRRSSVSLSAVWIGTGPYTQRVTIDGVTPDSLIELQPDANTIAQLIRDGVTSIVAENDDGIVRIKATGAAPTVAMNIQCTIMETTLDSASIPTNNVERISNKTTVISSESTDKQYPSAAAVYALFASIINANGVSY